VLEAPVAMNPRGKRGALSGLGMGTWPYGTKKKVQVIDFEPVLNSGNTFLIICAEEGTSEMFVLVRRGWPGNVRAQDRGTITFRSGGQVGGYWEYEAVEPEY
jgi:hypothetical protein